VTIDWCPGIREACAYWSDAPTLQQTFRVLEASLETGSDASIDAAKCLVECMCQVIVQELDDPAAPLKPSKKDVNINDWVAATTRLLGWNDVRNREFANFVKHHQNLATSLRELRNDAGPVSHGRNGFAQILSSYHHRSAVLAADAIVTFLHQAYLEAEVDLTRTNEPYERFARFHTLIDAHVSISSSLDAEGSLYLAALLPSGDVLTLDTEPSRLLYQLDRFAYVEALNAAREANSVATQEIVEE
jgi:hypothetical protein